MGAGVALALSLHHPFGLERDACALVGVMAGVLTAMGGVALLKWQRRRNEALSRWCEAEIRSGNEASLDAAHRAAIVLAFAVGVGYCAVCWGAGAWGLGWVVDREWLRLARAWSLAQPLWLGLGLAQLLNAFIQRRLARAALFGMGLVAAWLILMVGAPGS